MRVGSLFTGYGGLDMAVGGDVVWYSEIEPAACKILAEHYPGVPNLGDITVVDWSTVEPVDVITGGYPCQPFSTAGMRRGKNDERHLWPYVRNAISTLRPSFAVLENVRGHLSMGLADVIGDLAGVGYDSRWGLVRASDAGAPHGRARVFIVAYPDPSGLQGQSGATGKAQAERQGHIEPGDSLSTYTSGERYGRGKRPTDLERVGSSTESSGRQASATWQEFGARSTDYAANAESNNAQEFNGSGSRYGIFRRLEHRSCGGTDWGQYAAAVYRWEPIIGRLAPEPTIHRTGRDRLNPRFVEWMMGLPEGHVTGRGLSAAQELKMLGNGVCPQQAALALRLLGAA